MIKGKYIKKVVLILGILLIIANFIVPNYSYPISLAEGADDIERIPDYDPGSTVNQDDLLGVINSILASTEEEDNTEEEGGALFTPISQFILGISDGVISTLQATFIGDENFANVISADAIKETAPGNNGRPGVTTYRIKYSPAVIFSGEVPALDVNFFNPLGDENGTTKFYKTKLQYIEVEDNIDYKDCKRSYGASGTLQSVRDNMSLTELLAHGVALISVMNAVEALANTDWDYATYGGGGGFATIEAEGTFSIPLPADLGAASVIMFLGAAAAAEGVALTDRLKDKNLYYMQWKYNGETYYYIADSEAWLDTEDRENISGTLYKIGDTQTTEVYEKTSTAYTLRPTIARWYIALRNFSLVALLSILLYIGIRIIISSTAQDKSKYKKMLMDWLTAMAMLFILHYLMVIIMAITQKLTSIFSVSNIAADGTDTFVTNIRNMATGNNNDSYFKYFGYVIMYVAITILTLVFTIQYLKRLVFIAFLTLISPLIALTYPLDKIKDGQAQAFSIWIKEYIFNCLLQPVHLLLYTIFIGSATGLVDTNPVYAIVVLAFFTPAEKFFRKMFGFEKASSIGPLGAATGGALLMNMLNKLQGKATNHNSNSNNEEGNNKVRTVDNSTGYDNGQEPSENGENDTDSESSIVPGRKNVGTSGGTRKVGLGTSEGKISGNSGISAGINSARRNSGIRGGVKAVRRSIIGPSTLKSAGRWIGKKAIKAGGAFAGATIGLAAGVASGDLKDVTRNTIAGAVAGGNITTGIGRKIKNKTDKLYNTFKRGMQEEQRTQESTDDRGEKVRTKEKGDTKEETREDYINKGITEDNEITTAMENGISSSEYKAYEEAGITDIEEMVALNKMGITGEEYKGYEEAGVADVSTMTTLNEAGITADELKSRRKNGTIESKKTENLKKKAEETEEIPETDLGRVRYAERRGISASEYRSYERAGITDIGTMSSLKNSEVTASRYKEYESAGIKDAEQITLLEKAGISDSEYKKYKKAGISDIKEMDRLKKVNLTAEDLENLREIGQTDIGKIINIRQKHEDYSKEHFVNMFKLAKKSPKTLQEFKQKMQETQENSDNISEIAIEEIFKELKDFF